MSKPTFYRMTISISADLKRRMDKVKEDVVWSNLAATAFEAKLGEIASQKEKKEMSDVVERLRASKRKSEDEKYQEGFECGEEWAKDEAEAPELQRLEVAHARMGDDCYKSAGALVLWLVPQNTMVPQDVEAFWRNLLDEPEKAEDPEFLRGFGEGALGVWREVKDKL